MKNELLLLIWHISCPRKNPVLNSVSGPVSWPDSTDLSHWLNYRVRKKNTVPDPVDRLPRPGLKSVERWSWVRRFWNFRYTPPLHWFLRESFHRSAPKKNWKTLTNQFAVKLYLTCSEMDSKSGVVAALGFKICGADRSTSFMFCSTAPLQVYSWIFSGP